MRFHNTIDYYGQEFRYVWVNPNPGMESDVVENVLWNIADMHYDEVQRRKLNEDSFEATIDVRGERCWGMFSGKYFTASVESQCGRSDLGVILTDVVASKRQSPKPRVLN